MASRRGGATAPPKQQQALAASTGSAPPTVQHNVIVKLVLFSALMLLTPVAVFVANNLRYFDPLYEVTIGVPSPEKRSTVGGILAVIVANICVGVFIYSAFKDEDDAEEGARRRKTD